MDKKVLCAYLETCCRGRENAVSGRALEAAFQIREAELRRTVDRLRRGGHLICAEETEYFYAVRMIEIRAVIARLSGR